MDRWISAPGDAPVCAPGSSRAGIDVKNAASIMLQAADPALTGEERQDPARIAADAEINGVAC
jgi:hypothetical protein